MSAESKEHAAFIESACQHIASGVTGDFECPKEHTDYFANLPVARRRLNFALQQSLETAEDALRRFTRLFSNNFNHVLWAADFDDMFLQLRNIFKQWDVHTVCFPQLKDANELNDEDKCSLYHELGLPYFLQDERVEVAEEGKLQFFHPDRLLTDNGILLFNELNNKAVSLLNNGNINFFIVTIDQLLNATMLAELYNEFCRAFDKSKEGMQVMYRGTGQCSNYLLVVDNRRSEVLRRHKIRYALTCLQCQRCHSVCPVEQTAGKEAYNNVFSGPLGSIMLPYLENEEAEKHLTDACLLCGRCEEVCPLQLPLRDMVIANRKDFFSRDITDKRQSQLINKVARYLQNRSAMNKNAFLKHIVFSHFVNSDLKKDFELPDFSSESFNKQSTKEK